MLAGIAMVVLAATTWGTWSLFLRPTHLAATVTSPILFLVMGLVALPWALHRLRAGRWDRTTLGLLVAHGAFDALNVLAFFGAIAHTTVQIAVLTHYLAPILIAVAAPYLEKTSGRGTRGATLFALVGLVVVLEPWRAPADGALVGAAMGAASAVCYAGNVFTLRRLVPRIGAAGALAFHSLIAALLLLPLAVGDLGAITGSALGYMVAGAVVAGAAAGALFNVGLGRIGSARTAVLTYAEPLVAVTVGALVWDEPLHPFAAIGGAIVLGAGIHVARKAR